MSGKTIVGIKADGTREEFYPQELRASKLNAWKGWSCSVGQYNIAISENGDMKGGDCGVGGYLGNIYEEFRIPTEWHVCPLDYCSCFFDIGVPKRSLNPKSEYVEFTSKEVDLKFEWFLSAKCNYACTYCPDSYHNNLPHKNSSAQVFKGLDNLFEKLNGRTFTMSFWGGEPTLFPDYIPICKKINDYGARVFTTTNGSRSAKYLAELIHHSCLSISVHEDSYNQDRMIKNIKAIVTETKKHNLKNWVMVRCMAQPGKLQHWKSFIKALNREIPNFKESIKLTLNTLVEISSDKTNLSDDLLAGYTEKELALLKKFGRLTDV